MLTEEEAYDIKIPLGMWRKVGDCFIWSPNLYLKMSIAEQIKHNNKNGYKMNYKEE